MISVGLDIGRLGLMVVQGQPKAAAEYIQATSRVGRMADRPGLVLALLNVHKARDRLHYEGFRQFHASFYRTVEATSVTPWAARAVDRALAPAIVSLARHLEPDLSEEKSRRSGWKLCLFENSHRRRSHTPRQRLAGCRRTCGFACSGRHTDPNVDRSRCGRDAERRTSVLRLSHGEALVRDPLSPLLRTSGPDYERFKASRSMRDVEHVSSVEILDPFNNVIT